MPGVSTGTTKILKNSGKSKLAKLWSVEEQREEIRDGMKFLCIKNSGKSRLAKLWSVEEQREEIRDGVKFLCGSSSPASSVTQSLSNVVSFVTDFS